eukprot:TRINITY_DN65718_c11_g3_i1.p1 TRINITY_DN65718_c11_g3~~TRINITY_DN65718_c11_g3_i1.p1  ORF type:complete len:104 (+),score=38.08 TRINITY_DN65718_c11_g3_i1:184-495(+)
MVVVVVFVDVDSDVWLLKVAIHSELVEFVPHEKWLNPLMGWTSSNDTATQVKMSFDTKEEAIAFCERQGYEFKVVEAKPKRSRVKSYADNYRADQYMPIQKKQ